MVLSTTPPRAARRWAAPAAAGLFAVAVALSGVTIVRADDKPTPAEKLKLSRQDGWAVIAKRAAVQDDKPKPATDKPAEAEKPADRKVELRRLDGANVEKLRKQIDEALAAGKTDEAKKLVDALVRAFAPPMPEAPRPPAAPQPPAREQNLTLAIVSADARVREALAAMQKAVEATKDPEARAAMERAFKLLRDMPQERVPMVGGVVIDNDGRATVIQRDPAGSGQLQTIVRRQPGDIRPGGLGEAVLTWGGGARNLEAALMNLGLSVAPLPEAVAEQLELPPGTGLLVTAVRPDSPFAKAGARKNDVIFKVSGAAVTGGQADLIGKLGATKAGELVGVTVMRKGKEVSLAVAVPKALGERLDRPAAKRVRFESMKMEVFNGGVSIEATVGDMRYKVTGAQVGEQLDNAVITVTDLKTGKSTVQAGTVLTELGEKDRAAVQTLLDQIRGR